MDEQLKRIADALERIALAQERAYPNWMFTYSPALWDTCYTLPAIDNDIEKSRTT